MPLALVASLALSPKARAQHYFGPLPSPPPLPSFGVPDYGPPYDGSMPFDGAGLWDGPQSGPWEPPEAPFYEGPWRRHRRAGREPLPESLPSSSARKSAEESVLGKIERHLANLGLRQITAPRRKHKIYIIAATEPNGRRHRVIFNAATGALVENRPLGEPLKPAAKAKPKIENDAPKGEEKPEGPRTEPDEAPSATKPPVQRPIMPDDPPPTRG